MMMPVKRTYWNSDLIFTRLVSLLLVVIALVLSPLQVEARAVHYEVKKQNISDVIDVLSDLSGVAVSKAGDIKGSIENWRVKADGVEVFQKLAKDAGLFMAFDGSTVILASKADTKTKVLESSSHNWASVRSLAKSLFPIMPEDALTYDTNANLVLVRGPAPFNEAIAGIVAKPKNTVVRIIRGGDVQDIQPQTK